MTDTGGSGQRLQYVHRLLRFAAGVALGAAILAVYLSSVGASTVLDRVTAVAPWMAGVVLVLVVLEGLVDGIGVWASVAPLGDGITGVESVQFALAGDFFDILSPAGPVSSEPIMARFFSVATATGYSDALGVRSTAKYVKSGTQVLLSGTLGLVLLTGSPALSPILLTLGGAIAGLLVVGAVTIRTRTYLSKGLVVVLAPLVRQLSGLYRDDPHDRAVVVAAVERYWQRIVDFRQTPGLLALIGLGGVLEQVLTATALWVALTGLGASVPLLALVVLIPLPQVASVVPIPGSLGAYDLLLGGALVLVTGTSDVTATAAVLLVRTNSLPFGAIAGGLSVAYLRGWRPGA